MQVSPASHMRFPQTGLPPPEEELLEELLLAVVLEDDDAVVLLDEALELEEASPLLLAELAPLPPVPLEVCPVEFVPAEVILTPPAPFVVSLVV